MAGHERLARARRAKQQYAPHVLDAELLDEPGREHATGERATEDVAELGVEAADAHVLELEVWRDDGVRGRLLGAALELDETAFGLEERDVGLVHEETELASAVTALLRLTSSLHRRELDDVHAADVAAHVGTVVLEHDDLAGAEYVAAEQTDEGRGDVVRRELLCDVETLVPEAKVDIERGEVDFVADGAHVERLDLDVVALAELEPLAMKR